MSEAKIDWRSLLVALAIPLGVGVVGSIWTSSSLPTWFRRLDKPRWNPPDWLFGPVWTTLYVLMGIASWLVWRRRGVDDRVAEAERTYGAQLGLNLLWTLIFFVWRTPLLALIEIVVLWQRILTTIRRFYQISPVAAALLVPYQIWVTYAASLNAGIWWLNRGQGR